ncbi:hypothetical protein FGO68_gene14854 [Halteria grandinella]|uniref:Uncharacterized protein n=1 Tax=Halteria grandinella TaxID=5974 RepID=A0A8J8NEB7_HALGN|nr:hypothetical protein FGO68_gene14854 [Halteria grandinella]
MGARQELRSAATTSTSNPSGVESGSQPGSLPPLWAPSLALSRSETTTSSQATSNLIWARTSPMLSSAQTLLAPLWTISLRRRPTIKTDLKICTQRSASAYSRACVESCPSLAPSSTGAALSCCEILVVYIEYYNKMVQQQWKETSNTYIYDCLNSSIQLSQICH